MTDEDMFCVENEKTEVLTVFRTVHAGVVDRILRPVLLQYERVLSVDDD